MNNELVSFNQTGYEVIASVLPNIMAEINEESSGRIYKHDITSFVFYLANAAIDVISIDRIVLLNYRKHLTEEGKVNITVNRMFFVACVFVAELVAQGYIAANPLSKRFKPLATNNETTHVALGDAQAMQLLKIIDTSTIKGKRDYAMVSLMLRSGLRREEVQQLNIGDIKMKQGHYVVDIRSGKGNKPATIKIAPDVYRYLDEYLKALPIREVSLDSPLFLSLRKGDHLSLNKEGNGKRIDIKAVETTVKRLGDAIGVPGLTPHGLRATFITLAMEHGASLEQTQYAARHSDPRTTERYRKRKLNLDDNAVDRLSFLSRLASPDG